jgi:hypothetical protein
MTVAMPEAMLEALYCLDVDFKDDPEVLKRVSIVVNPMKR